MQAYNPKITPWQIKEQDFPHAGSGTEQLLFLLRYAILAPSSHNTQPWKFSVSQDEIRISIDLTRWLRVADADQRELYISMGCALENLLIAVEHFGYGYRVAYFPQLDRADLVAIVKFRPLERRSSFRGYKLFEAIPARHTNHKVYYDVYPSRWWIYNTYKSVVSNRVSSSGLEIANRHKRSALLCLR